MKENKVNLGLGVCIVVAAFAAVSVFGKPKSPQAVSNAMKAQPSDQVAVAKQASDPPSSEPLSEGIKVPVLMYHHVGYMADIYVKKINDPVAIDLTVSPEDFEAQVQYLKNLGYRTVSVQQVYDNLTKGDALPEKPIVFTFDDGYRDALTKAVAILQKYGFTGTFAIATELLGRTSYGTWDDVIAAQKAGMEIVSHTENHLDLTNKIYSDSDLHREIFDSKQILESKLGVPVNFFVYPYGSHNTKVENLVAEAGYKMAFTTAYGQYLNENSLLVEPRVRVHGQDGLEKLKKIIPK